MSLYRKYRPQLFHQVIGQEHVTKTLRGALMSHQLGHAYIFAGPRGTGKTSIARIFAKAVNCPTTKDGEPCGACDICTQIVAGSFLDLIEIDAASNRGIDEIRELKEKVHFAPNQGIYKVYIIDEAHMLTREAFNALLKTLEEPPKHVIFILATTEVHKIPLTILSRCQRFDFHVIETTAMARALKDIAQKEGISIDDASIMKLVAFADGSFRDSLSYLDQVHAFAGDVAINESLLADILGYSDKEKLKSFMKLLADGDTRGLLSFIHAIVTKGVDIEVFIKDVIRFIRYMLISDTQEASSNPQIIFYGDVSEITARFSIAQLVSFAEIFNNALHESRFSFLPQLQLELAIMKHVRPPTQEDIAVKTTQSAAAKDLVTPVAPLSSEPSQVSSDYKEPTVTNPAERTTTIPSNASPPPSDNNRFQRFLEYIKKEKSSLAMVLQSADIRDSDDMLTITMSNNFYFEQLTKAANQLFIESAVRECYSPSHKVHIIKADRSTGDNPKSPENNFTTQVLNTFGGHIIK